MSSSPALQEAYGQCEAITRAQAANFFYGIRLLARERRRALCAVYAFARRIDDIGDGALPRERKLEALDAQARALGGGEAGADPVFAALADARARYPLPEDALRELIEGVRMDVTGTSYETFEELLVYCRRVAGGIGRLCLAIFALREPAASEREHAERLADELGVALQLTNILRDLREDALGGRVYLPAEDLRRFGVIDGEHEDAGARAQALLELLEGSGAGTRGAISAERALASQHTRLDALVRFECQRAEAWFERGIGLTRLLDRRSAACVLAMAGIYRRLLARIELAPEEAARTRLSLPAREKAWVAARGLLGAGV